MKFCTSTVLLAERQMKRCLENQLTIEKDEEFPRIGSLR